MLPVWDENAWEDYLWWEAQDRRVLKRTNALLADIQRNGNDGIGKPEALKHDFAGYWSRRITDEHRLVYKIAGDEVRIAACSPACRRPSQRTTRTGPVWGDGGQARRRVPGRVVPGSKDRTSVDEGRFTSSRASQGPCRTADRRANLGAAMPA